MSGNVVKRRAVAGDEVDVFSSFRKYLCWTQRPGQCKYVKRKANRRERREGRREVQEQASD